MTTILIVEDNAMNMKLTSVILKTAGYDILQAEDGETAIDLAQENKPDLILMDVQMAGMDGLSATRILKGNQETAAIPVIALTAFAMRGDEEKILAAGCDGYLPKPFQRDTLLATISMKLAT